MFTSTEYEIMTLPYFNVINDSPDFFEIQSKNTGHFWAIMPLGNYVRLYHKYKKSHKYHFQTDTMSVLDAVLEIVNHDDYKLHRKGTFFEELVATYGHRTSNPLVS